MLTKERELMEYKVFTTNEPDKEKVIGDSEFIDLTRMGLLVKDKGDVDKDGNLKKSVAKDAPPAVLAAVTGSISTPGAQAFTSNQGS